MEWSTETTTFESAPCVTRGGSYDHITYYPAGRYRYNITDDGINTRF